MEVTPDLVERVARLARLSLSPEESREMEEHFRKVLAFVEELQQLDLEGVDPSLFSLDASDIVRDDVPGASLPVEDTLRPAPASSPPYFLVPRIVADREGGAGGDGDDGEMTP